MANNQIYVMKARFKALTTNTFGLFTIFLDRGSKKIDKLNVATSHFSSLYENNPEQEWAKFDSVITTLKYKGEVAGSLTNDFQSLFNNSFGPEVIETFVDCFETKNMSKTEHVLTSLIEKILSDKSLFVQLEKQIIQREDIEKQKQEMEKVSQAEVQKKSEDSAQSSAAAPAGSSMFNIEEGAALLGVGLVIGPISGIPVYEVKPGDQIYVKIAGKTQKEQYFIDLLNAKNDLGEVIPVPAVVREVKNDKQEKLFHLLVEIGPGIYGTATEAEQVKLKKYDPLLDPRTVKRPGASPVPSVGPVSSGPFFGTRRGGSPSMMIWVLGGVVLLLALLFFFFFFAR